MRYSESKEQSYELLKLALPLMAQQATAFHPVSYSLWYEHVGRLNPRLSEVLVARLEEKKPLTEDEAYRLHARFISVRDGQMLENLEQQLRMLLEDTAQHAALAGEETGRFRRTLAETRSQLAGGVSLEGIHAFISQLVSETSRMETSTAALSRKLEASRAEVRALNEALERSRSEALLDPLCGLNNRRAFEDAAEKIADPQGELAGVALLLADVDHFKRVNDTYGHLLGDKALRFIAQTMLANIKGRDVAARLSGEEFAILLPQTTLQGALALAEQLRQAVAHGRVRRAQGQDVVGAVTLSIGVAVGQPGETLEALRERADAALYTAKRSGRNRVCAAPIT